jgi:TRAP transporter TAXI family solute receptor
MKKTILISFIVCFTAGFIFNAAQGEFAAENVFVTIGSGDFTGVYFPTGLAIAKVINKGRDRHGIRATVESTRASIFNINTIMAGYLEFGIAQSDVQYQAYRGLGEWKDKGPQEELRSVFSIHRESICLVAAVDAGISDIADLEGKKVNLGNPGSGQHQNAIAALQAVGLDPQRDIRAEHMRASEAPGLLEDRRIDAFFCTVGHPSENLQHATSGMRKVRFIPITGPGIDRLVADKNYYTKIIVPVSQFYPDAVNPVDLKTFGVIATLCTSSKVSDHVVYTITKAVFDNFSEFKSQHQALAVLAKEDMLKGLSAPLHPGAEKYYKEVGLFR